MAIYKTTYKKLHEKYGDIFANLSFDRDLVSGGPWDKECDLYMSDMHEYPMILARDWTGCWRGFIGLPLKVRKIFNYCDHGRFNVHGFVNSIDWSPYEVWQDLLMRKILEDTEIHAWLGFSCDHEQDFYPNGKAYMFDNDNYRMVYRTERFAYDECLKLRNQVADYIKENAWKTTLRR